METTIYYFSGTGNSLKIAQDFANKLGNTELIPITKAIKENMEINVMLITLALFILYILGVLFKFRNNPTIIPIKI